MKKLIHSFIIGLVSAIAVYLTLVFKMPTWVLFMAWVSYYVFGQSLKAISHAYVQIMLGIGVAILITLAGQGLTPFLGLPAFPAAVMVIITVLIFGIEKLRPFTVIPAYFMGMIIFFGLNQPLTTSSLLLMAITVVSGLFFAWLAEFLSKLIITKTITSGQSNSSS